MITLYPFQAQAADQITSRVVSYYNAPITITGQRPETTVLERDDLRSTIGEVLDLRDLALLTFTKKDGTVIEFTAWQEVK